MRLCIVAALYYPYSGGLVASVHGLAAGLVQAGNDVTVMTCNTEGAEDESWLDGVHIIRVASRNPAFLQKSFPIPTFAGAIHFWRELRNQHSDILATQTRFFPLCWFGVFFAKLKHIPVVHTERGAGHPVLASKALYMLAVCLDHTLGTLLVRGADAVIGVSASACDFLRHLGARNPLRIPNGIDVNFWKQRPHEHIQRNDTIIVFVGRLVIGKGVQDLLRALQHPRLNKIKLIIVGSGPYQRVLESQARRAGMMERVVFTGELSLEKIRSLFTHVTLFVNPSHSEGLPRSVLEAAAAGLPIVATDVGGTNEIIQHEETGLLVPSENPHALTLAIERLLENPQLRERFGKSAQTHVSAAFRWEKIVQQYVSVFQRICVES